MYGYDPARTSYVPARDLPPADADARRFSQTGTRNDGGGSVESPSAVAGGALYYRAWNVSDVVAIG